MRLNAAPLVAALLLALASWAQSAAAAPQAGDVATPPARVSSTPGGTRPEGLRTRAPEPADDAADCIRGDTVVIDPGHGLHVGTQSYAQTLRLCDHQVVLTFDDGPSPETTPSILKALKDAGVHATFFLVGRRTREHPELARQEFAEGHTVGHHSDTHPSFTLRGFDEASAEHDIENGIAADERAVYGDAATPDLPHVPFFRFPGFADTPELLRYLDGRGIGAFGSDLWAGDWVAMSPEHERQRIVALLEKRPLHNGMILFHDTKASTARMLPALLAELRAKGYHVVQMVYAEDAPRPALTEALPGEPETQRIVAHLHPPIVPGSHHLGGGAAEGSGESPEDGQP